MNNNHLNTALFNSFVLIFLFFVVISVSGCSQNSISSKSKTNITTSYEDGTFLNDLIDLKQINKIHFLYNDKLERIVDKSFFDSLFSILNIEYRNTLYLENEGKSVLDFIKEVGNDDLPPYTFNIFYGDESYSNFIVYSSGYVLVTLNTLVNNEYTKKGEYISAFKVNYNSIANLCEIDKLNKYQKDNNYTFRINIFRDLLPPEFVVSQLSIVPSITSSHVYIIQDQNDITELLSYFQIDEYFEKELYIGDYYYFSCMSISIAYNIPSGESGSISFKVDKDGAINIISNDDNIVYYSDKNVVNYEEILKYLNKKGY